MRQLLLVLGLLGATGALAVGSAGCSNSCDELSARCDNCLDADYREDCREVADAQIQNTCSKRQALFDAYCPDISEVLGETTATTSTGVGGASTTTTSTTSAGGATSNGGSGGTPGAGGMAGAGGTAGAGGA